MKWTSLAILTMFAGAMACLYLIFTSPEYTAQYTRYTAAKTAIRQAEEQTKQVQAQQWSNTVRGTVPWLAGGLAAAAVAGVGGWAVVEWQRNRTQRHVATEDYTTQRHLITAKRDITLAYIAQCGDPNAHPARLNGIAGVFLPSENEFVPMDVCRAELEQSTALVRRQPQTVNVPTQRERRFKVVGEMEEY